VLHEPFAYVFGLPEGKRALAGGDDELQIGRPKADSFEL
jgi:hypothetical protein